jgi:hypothetical protein
MYVGLSPPPPPTCRPSPLGLPGSQERQQIKRATYLPTYFFWRFLRFFWKYTFGVFELLVQRNGQKRDKKSKESTARKQVSFALHFFVKSF